MEPASRSFREGGDLLPMRVENVNNTALLQVGEECKSLRSSINVGKWGKLRKDRENAIILSGEKSNHVQIKPT